MEEEEGAPKEKEEAEGVAAGAESVLEEFPKEKEGAEEGVAVFAEESLEMEPKENLESSAEAEAGLEESLDNPKEKEGLDEDSVGLPLLPNEKEGVDAAGLASLSLLLGTGAEKEKEESPFSLLPPLDDLSEDPKEKKGRVLALEDPKE